MKYAFFDIDGTIYNGYSSNDLIEYLFNEKVIPAHFYPEYKSMSDDFRTGQIPYNTAIPLFVELSGKMLKGLKEQHIRDINEKLIQENRKLFPWVIDVIHLLRENDYSVHLLSAAIETIAKAIADLVKADSVNGSQLEINNGIYTGNVVNILNHTAKTTIIKEILGETHPMDTIGFGDSVGDIEMLLLTNQAFVVNPKQDELLQIIKDKGWIIFKNGEESNQLKEYLLGRRQ